MILQISFNPSKVFIFIFCLFTNFFFMVWVPLFGFGFFPINRRCLFYPFRLQRFLSCCFKESESLTRIFKFQFFFFFQFSYFPKNPLPLFLLQLSSFMLPSREVGCYKHFFFLINFQFGSLPGLIRIIISLINEDFQLRAINDANYLICDPMWQVRRYVYHDVVRLGDLEKLIDCSYIQVYQLWLQGITKKKMNKNENNFCVSYRNGEIIRITFLYNFISENFFLQPYTINGAKVIFLNQRPQSRTCRGSANICLTCDRILQEPFHFCSLACKVQFFNIIFILFKKGKNECNCWLKK